VSTPRTVSVSWRARRLNKTKEKRPFGPPRTGAPTARRGCPLRAGRRGPPANKATPTPTTRATLTRLRLTPLVHPQCLLPRTGATLVVNLSQNRLLARRPGLRNGHGAHRLQDFAQRLDARAQLPRRLAYVATVRPPAPDGLSTPPRKALGSGPKGVGLWPKRRWVLTEHQLPEREDRDLARLAEGGLHAEGRAEGPVGPHTWPGVSTTINLSRQEQG
jgi:hypothetical protein